MTVTLNGGCACGEVRYRLTSAPMFVHCCHCLNCQRHTGSAFVINLLIEAARVELLSGAPLPVTMPLGGGTPNRIFRCPGCQVALWSEYGGRSQVWFVRGGTLDEPSAVAPDVHIYTRSKLPWVQVPESVPAFDAYYDPKTLWPASSLERRKAALGGATNRPPTPDPPRRSD
ncbi:MAG: GFA family protein [Candidatus Eisenbacteria bacterium]|uniref:GFA family protein n=1 Tax=Eiseniibacteriota bacterium TaxID=2212470 RepID=A0A538TZ22_UNCEI|nr:MAG: GFA family protein [Candidatus Eisenbacteria bacterium]